MTSKADILSQIEASRKELLDLSFRNPLLNFRPSRARGVEMAGESAEQVFDVLVNKRQPMSFLAGSEENARQSDRRLQTGETPETLERRLLNTYRLARSTIEETGVNTLFVALGTLHWYEADASSEARRSPLLLVPVQLERAGVRERFQVSWSGEDIGANLPLAEKIRADFGLALPGAEEAAQVADDTISMNDYFALVSEQTIQAGMSRWQVDSSSVALGFFSYNKIMMYRDLDDAAWPAGEGLSGNGIIQSLFGNGFAEPPSAISDDAHLDDHLAPQDVYNILNADSSQSLAIHDAVNNRNLVIQGPPGTGKSQTIANIIAEAVARGKRVLFVAEKMAALEVVKRRLDAEGLGDACLELHSHKTNKRDTLDSLQRTLDMPPAATAAPNSTLEDLAAARQRLNEYAKAVNTPVGAGGVSPYVAFGRLLSAADGPGANPVSWEQISGPGLRMQSWTAADYQRKREVVEELRLRLQQTGVPAQHPFYGCRLRNLLPAGQAALNEKIAEMIAALETLADASGALAESLNLERPAAAPDFVAQAAALIDLAWQAAAAPPEIYGMNLAAPEWRTGAEQLNELLAAGFRWQGLRAEHQDILQPEAWDTEVDLVQLRGVLHTTGRSFFGRLFSSRYKEAKTTLAGLLRGQLPRNTDRQLELINVITNERQLRRELDAPPESGGKYALTAAVLGDHWAGSRTDWDSVAPPARWLLNLQADITAGRRPPEIITALQACQQAAADANSGAAFIDEASKALASYHAGLAELQTALDLDNASRFDNPEGLAAMPLAGQVQVLEEWAARLPEIQDIIGFQNSVGAVLHERLHPVVEVAESNPAAAEHLTRWFERAWYESIVETAFGLRPALQGFDSRLHEDRIRRFKELDEQSFAGNRERVIQAHRQGPAQLRRLPERLLRVPANGEAAPAWGANADSDPATIRRLQEQLRFLQREIAKRTRHRPIRQLISEAGEILQELKPVFMMSPLSIATYLTPGSVKFDMVVFDEASQVRPVDALGALLRGKKAVVVGDDKQLPPTSFFDRAAGGDDESEDEDEAVTAGIESVLSLFSARGAPSRRLRWHYRSRHESLIAVSNREFYNNDLVVFPSPHTDQEATGLSMTHLPDAVFDRGRSATNRAEAEAVAQAVMQHAVHRPHLTLGVAAFSISQAGAIEDRLEMLRRQDDSGEEFFASHPAEPFFVKNLENVQGDERDVIFISVGYGRDERGQVGMNFGPLNREGGERRLNVLITRAKQQCRVFTNLRGDDIDLARSASVGVRAFKTFLEYAEKGIMPVDLAYESDFEVDSPFQREVARRLEERGYLVRQEIASAGKFIDIGIVDPERPGRYLIGIECDGATYHGSQSARDRDRLRELMLRGLGWELHRIWSTDWFRNPERELQRAVTAIEQARSKPE